MEAKLQQQVPQQNHVNKPNLTGIPTQMKLDFERRSGLSFDDVRVHYNSDKPAQLQALAYTQGTQVYVGPGQERYLPHELGHVIQQKAGVVRPTKIQNGSRINDSLKLEKMADQITAIPSIVQMRRINQNGEKVIQCAGNVHVAVSLFPYIFRNTLFTASELLVDTINIVGRSDTGLIPETGQKESQGDHVIADVLVKREQKAKGWFVSNVLNDYYVKCSEIIRDVKIAWDHVANVVSTNSSVTPKEKDDIKRYQVPDSYIYTDLKFAHFPASTFARFIRAHKLAQTIKGRIVGLSSQARLIPEWTVALEKIIIAYNEAYAHSPYSTQGKKGTGGHGEGAGNDYLDKYLNDIPNGHKVKAEALFDLGSRSQLPTSNVTIGRAQFTGLLSMLQDVQPLLSTSSGRDTMHNDVKSTIEDLIKAINNTSAANFEIELSLFRYINYLYRVALTKTSNIRIIRHKARREFDILKH